MTCVCLNGHTQYFFIGMVWFESQEYTLQGRMQFFAKLEKTLRSGVNPTND